jgi:hypothetical protein
MKEHVRHSLILECLLKDNCTEMVHGTVTQQPDKNSDNSITEPYRANLHI